MMRILKLIFLLLVSFTSFGQTWEEDEVFAHVSKNIILTKDQIWFYLQVSNGNQPSLSKIAYIELIDRENLPVLQMIVPLNLGKAEGALEIPPQLESDHYLLRFYTRISPLNEKSKNGVYNQMITIINPKKGPLGIKPKQSQGIHTFEKGIDFQISESRVKQKSQIELPLNFIKRPYNISIAIQNPFLPENFQGFIGQEIYQPITEKHNVISELYGHIVHGKNISMELDTTETFFLSAHGRQSTLHSAKPDQDGNLFFELGPLKEYTFLIAQSLNYEKQLNFAPQSPFWNLKLKEDFAFPPLELNEEDREFLEKLILSAQLKPYFYPAKATKPESVVTGFVADKTYFLDDYN